MLGDQKVLTKSGSTIGYYSPYEKKIYLRSDYEKEAAEVLKEWFQTNAIHILPWDYFSEKKSKGLQDLPSNVYKNFVRLEDTPIKPSDFVVPSQTKEINENNSISGELKKKKTVIVCDKCGHKIIAYSKEEANKLFDLHMCKKLSEGIIKRYAN